MTNKKDIKGYEGLYEIYDDGRVFGKKRKKFLKHSINKSTGYYHVVLSKDGKKTTHKIHRLVAEAFIPNPMDKPEVDHKDRKKLNNVVKNLQWCTHGENMCNKTIHSNKTKGQYVGVVWYKTYNKWRVNVQVKGKYEHIGYYDDEEEGYKARKEYIEKNLPELYKIYYPD